jgi:hypothetical protein
MACLRLILSTYVLLQACVPCLLANDVLPRTEVVHCISDPTSETAVSLRGMKECPQESYQHRGRCLIAYIDHYKEMLQEEVGRKENITKYYYPRNVIQVNHLLPRKEAVCIDIDEDCKCTWLVPHTEMCSRIKPETILMVGDSMIYKQNEELQRICDFTSKKSPFVKIMSDRSYFFANNKAHNIRLDDHLHRKHNLKIAYVGFGLHHLQTPNDSVVPKFEFYINATLHRIKKLRPDLRIVWIHSNTIISRHFNGEYQNVTYDLLSGLRKENESLEASKKRIASSFTRRGVVGLHRRAERFFDEINSKLQTHVQIIDGLQITDFMELYSKPGDGRHFFPLLRLKLSILFTRNRGVLLS